MNTNFDLEKELNNFDEMSSSIDKIKQDKKYDNREMFKDVQTDTKCKDCKDSKGKNFDINNFVSDLENKLDNFDNIDFQSGPTPSNLNEDFKNHKKGKLIEKNIEKIGKINSDNINIKPKKKHNTLDKKILKILVKMREPFIVLLLFILLNNKDLIELINRIPYIAEMNSDYPSLIIRGLMLGLIIYNLKKYSK